MSNSLQSHGLWPTRLLCPWNSSGKNTGVGNHSLLQGIFLTQGLNLGLLHCSQILYHLSHKALKPTLICFSSPLLTRSFGLCSTYTPTTSTWMSNRYYSPNTFKTNPWHFVTDLLYAQLSPSPLTVIPPLTVHQKPKSDIWLFSLITYI